MTGGVDRPDLRDRLDLRFTGGARVRFTGRPDGDLGSTEPGPVDPAVLAHRRDLVTACGVASIVAGHQVHGARVAVVRDAPRPPGYRVSQEASDGQATGLRGVGVAVHAADCLPIALAGDGGVGIVHAGWRGLAGGVIAAGVDALRTRLGVRGPIEAAIGPAAGGCCYETGPDVRAAFGGRHAPGVGRRLDLKEVARRQLAEAGVAGVHDVGICTLCAESGLVFSYRRDGPRVTGRQAGVAWLE